MKKIIKTIPYIIIAVFVGITAVYAGSLTPPEGPITNTMHSLTDIYNLATGDGESTINPTLTNNPTLVGSGKTLNQVYDAVSTALLQAGGANLSNMFNGSCIVGGACAIDNEFPGGTQAQGGVDDANYDTTGNLTQAPPVGRYETDWTTCNIGNNYCGTGDSGANAKDEATGLVWSYPLTGLGGSSWDKETDTAVLTDGCVPSGNCAYWDTDTSYSWDNSRVGNDTKTAQVLCSQHTGWSLPHQKQLMQAYIDGAYGNLDPQGVDRYYWSSTTYSDGANVAWYVGLSVGYTGIFNETNDYIIRCVQE